MLGKKELNFVIILIVATELFLGCLGGGKGSIVNAPLNTLVVDMDFGYKDEKYLPNGGSDMGITFTEVYAAKWTDLGGEIMVAEAFYRCISPHSSYREIVNNFYNSSIEDGDTIENMSINLGDESWAATLYDSESEIYITFFRVNDVVVMFVMEYEITNYETFVAKARMLENNLTEAST